MSIYRTRGLDQLCSVMLCGEGGWWEAWGGIALWGMGMSVWGYLIEHQACVNIDCACGVEKTVGETREGGTADEELSDAGPKEQVNVCWTAECF